MSNVEDQTSVIDLRDSVIAGRAALVGRLAVVIGAATPTGRAIALALVAAGARVCAVDGDVEALRKTVAAAGKTSPILYLQCDLGSESEISGVTDFIDRFDRPLELLVLAGSLSLESGEVADLDEQYLVNVRGAYLVTQQLLGLLREGRGRVVFVTEGGLGSEDDLQHSVNLAGVRAIADGLRSMERDSGIRVTTLSSRLALSEDGPVAVDPLDIAVAVVQAVSAPERVELSAMEVRPVLHRSP
jgi:NAD(P)-dependent dehydrogenase (short-subunit alcohol dehydrogenase family)